MELFCLCKTSMSNVFLINYDYCVRVTSLPRHSLEPMALVVKKLDDISFNENVRYLSPSLKNHGRSS